jgi:RimJ/RimL family protein N-acetyltransferase
MNIKGKIVTLRAIEEKDLILLHKWANDPELQDKLSTVHFPSSMDFHNEWFKKLKNDTGNQRLAIDVPEIGIIGLSTLMNIDWKNGHAHHGIEIGDIDIRGKGYGFDSLMAHMRHAFAELRFERLETWIFEPNTISLSLYKKCGWQEEGRRRNYFFRKGRFYDQILVGIIKMDYYQLIEKTKYWEPSL